MGKLILEVKETIIFIMLVLCSVIYVILNNHRRSSLLSEYGHTTVTLSSANSYSYEKVKMTFEEYCDKHTGPQNIKTLGNETFYM